MSLASLSPRPSLPVSSPPGLLVLSCPGHFPLTSPKCPSTMGRKSTFRILSQTGLNNGQNL
ncbi:hypothetical protein E2C01_032174 [Portunus trituberculatus]|uniref:Uncharacterized protein n=1 Tax=Portunus trituberculatus TaxID=210409 RepID=A0A5B7F0N8_PORTR|nr:hypothetical protein [Portunus trituberculatus]